MIDVQQWLTTPEKLEPSMRSTLYTKVVIALMSARDAHLKAMREPTTHEVHATSPTS